MSDDNKIIEGELAKPSERTEVVTRADSAGAVQVHNPLDAEPVTFARQLEVRQNNYDNLREHLFGELVPGKDFKKLHINKDCKERNCSIDWHYTGYELMAPGADKILGILGLAVHYPDLKDYKRAVLTGVNIEEVIADAQILNHGNNVISAGVGACARSEINGGNLNNTIKRACKRARVDAVKRLPTISALFEDDILAELEAAAKRNENNAARKRIHTIKTRWNTGATLEVCPIGTDIKGKPWHEIDTEALEWIVANVIDKPDIFRAASRELTHRASGSGSDSISTAAPADSSDEPGSSEQ